MRQMIKKILLFILVFFLVFRPEFIFIPLGVNLFFGTLGFAVYCSDNKTRNKLFRLSHFSFAKMFKLFVPPLICSFISLIINSSVDLYFPRYVISMMFAFWAAYLLAWGFVRTYGELTCKKLAEYMIYGCVIYVLIALICFFNPSLYTILNSLQRMDEIAAESFDRTEGTRLIGIGANFYTSAIINGLILILMGVCIAIYKYSILKKLILVFMFILISVLALMMARTVMFGILIGGVFLLSSFIRTSKDFYQALFVTVLLLICIFVLVPILFKNYASDLEVLASFGFEMFINKSQGGKMESHSMLQLYEMWATLPDNIKTWIFGDALWEYKGGYYKGVDLGYLRHLYYFGLIGTFFLFRYYYLTIKRIFLEKRLFSPKHKWVVFALCVFVLILNAKGPCDLFLYIIPFYFCNNYMSQRKKQINANRKKLIK